MKSVQWVSLAEEMNPSCRSTMEDTHRVVDSFCGGEGQGFFAVYDGHGGRGVAEFLEERLDHNVRLELEHSEKESSGGKCAPRPVAECLCSAYFITDIESSKRGLMMSGSTAATCLIRREGDGNRRVLYAANVGDTRAVLCRKGGTAQRLTYDHKASDPSEMKRIEESGGFVLRKRVLGILAVSRSFGDHSMKKFVVARPHVTETVLTEDDDFLIIACDGVWDILTDQEAVDLVRREMEQNSNENAAVANVLVQRSLAGGSTDNITALVIKL